MESENFTQPELNKIMESMDGISKAEMPPFFYTRLMANIEKRSTNTHSLWRLVTKPAVSLVTLSLLVILNVAAINYYLSSPKKAVADESSGIEKFAEEYDLNVSSLYNEKIIK